MTQNGKDKQASGKLKLYGAFSYGDWKKLEKCSFVLSKLISILTENAALQIDQPVVS